MSATQPAVDPDIVEKFHFTQAMLDSPIFRKYEKATRGTWNAHDIDLEPDAADWQRISPEQQKGLLGVTVRFLAGEQQVTNELVPMIAAAHRLRRFDWTMYLATFMVEEARHAEFFMLWHRRVTGMLEPEECARHFLARSKTIDPTGRFEIRDIMHTGLPSYGDALVEACTGGSEAEVERAFVCFATAYNALAEGVLTMPSYEIVIDTCDQWDAFPALKQGFRRILADEGRHITFGTEASRILIAEHPEYEALVHETIGEYRGNAVGMLEYQRSVPGLDLDKYQRQKVRHYRNRCREMGVTPDEELLEAILDPSVDFVVGVQAG